MHPTLAKVNLLAYGTNTPIHNLFEFTFKQNSTTKRPELLPLIKDMKLDDVFKKIAATLFRKNPFHLDEEEKQDLIIDALNNVLTPNAVAAYNPSMAFVSYFGSIFQKKLITELQEYTRRKTTEKDNFDDSDISDSERMDLMGGPDDSQDIEHYVEFKQLMTNLDKYLNRTPQGAKIAPMLPMLMAGESSKDIAEAMGISAGAVSQYLTKLKDFIGQYAKETKNSLLLALVDELAGKRRHADPDLGFFKTVFELYKKKRFHSEQEEAVLREAVGGISKIQVTTREDVLSREAKKQRAQQATQSVAEQEAEVEQLIRALQESDDVIESSGNRLSLLRVSASEIRN